MTTPQRQREKRRKRKSRNGWTLYHDLFSVKWKNGVADEVEISGCRLKVIPSKLRKKRP